MFDDKNIYWWKSERSDMHRLIFEFTKTIKQRQNYQSTNNLRHMRLYGNQETLGMGLSNYSATQSTATKNRVTLNIIQSMCDTATSKITKSQPEPMFLTDGGNWSDQRKAKKLNQFVKGMFNYTETYSVAALAFLDACVWGTGVIKTYRVGGEIKIERVISEELLFDDNESIHGNPRQLHQTKFIHRDILISMFPKYEAKIREATNSNREGIGANLNSATDMLEVIESWHLKSGEEAKDGKHTIVIDTTTLLDEEYSRDDFPFSFIKWSPRLMGFWGQGLAEQLQGLQVEINKILRNIQIGMNFVCVPRILQEAGSKIVTGHINNDPRGAVVKYSGVAPEFWIATGALPRELFEHLDRLYTRSFEIAGISELSAQSKKPSGLDSGKALRTFNDIETERFLTVGRRWEDLFKDLAKKMIAEAKAIDEDKDQKDFSVKIPGKEFFETIKWKDINMSEDRYIISCFPKNAFSDHPASKLQDIQEFTQAGLLSPQQTLKLLDFPDLKAEQALLNAPLDNIHFVIDKMMDTNEYLPPEPYQDLQLGIQTMQQAYLLYETQGAPEDKLEKLQLWIEDATAKLQVAQGAPEVNPAAIEGGPVDEDALLEEAALADEAAMAGEEAIGVPEAPPTSDLLPV